MTRRERDYGTAASYRAEAAAFGAAMHGDLWSPAEIAAAAAQIHRDHGDGRSTPRLEFAARRRGGGMAYSGLRLIRLGGAGSTLPILLHELAHVYTPHAGHGPAWRREYVRLVRAVLGDVDADRLVAAFGREGVPIDATTRAVAVRARPRRRWQVMMQPTCQIVVSTRGNATTYRTETTGPAVPAPDLALSPAEAREIRRGFVLLRPGMRIWARDVSNRDSKAED